ncbi:type II toxin-antitoxin system VapC family toxin [Mesorhizobium loti]|uniref:Ribonuclease VapC n=1 Tax=Mesorhizobium loti R88b TaxID=935548 RepID=A0A6M7WLG6_RHILI|nr:type II toxin-antitoxin system VapC family toxin [Mesorhizobium loti]QKD02446.1 type II toxin-antitoxin system VapC family toxin [Mesorhizobium loti R88b]
MIIDSSAIVAILRSEADRDIYLSAIDRAEIRRIPAPNLVETTMVLTGLHRSDMMEELDAFLRTASIETIAFTADHAAVARQAFLRYGKGRHPAALNFGDCIAYATARLEAMPLLFKGDDFRLTDIEAAV